MANHRLTDADLDRWVERGLITSAQRTSIEQDLAGRGPAESALTLTTLLYYGGGLLVLIAYSIFLGFQWEELASGGRVAISVLSFGFFAGVSQILLKGERFRLPGELLQVVAVALVPLLTFAVLDAADLWPDDPGYSRFDYQSAQHDYQVHLTWGRMALAAATLAVAAIAFRMSKSQFVLLAAIVSIGSLFVDLTLLGDGTFQDYTWHTGQSMMVAAMGAATFIAGIAVRDRGERDYSTWLYIAGLAGLAAGLGSAAIPEYAANAWGFLWMGTALAILALSLPLQQRLFAAAGLLAIFAYLAKLVFEVFESANAALALVVLGLLVLGSGMLYQRMTEGAFRAPQAK